MERFKALEKETKIKAYSQEGLNLSAKRRQQAIQVLLCSLETPNILSPLILPSIYIYIYVRMK